MTPCGCTPNRVQLYTLSTQSCTNMSVSPSFSIPGRWVEGPISWPTSPTTVCYTVVPSPPDIYTFQPSHIRSRYSFSIYSRTEGDLHLYRETHYCLCAHKSSRLCLRGMRGGRFQNSERELVSQRHRCEQAGAGRMSIPDLTPVSPVIRET